LNHLRISVEDIDSPHIWIPILVEIVQSAEGVQHLAVQVWGLLAELTTSCSRLFENWTTYNPLVTDFLLDAQEWEKLECWLGVVWTVWLPETGDVTENIKSATNLLFRQKPDAVGKLSRWIGRWSEKERKAIAMSFQEICEQAQQDAT
jgi:hypothetical protein